MGISSQFSESSIQDTAYNMMQLSFPMTFTFLYSLGMRYLSRAYTEEYQSARFFRKTSFKLKHVGSKGLQYFPGIMSLHDRVFLDKQSAQAQYLSLPQTAEFIAECTNALLHRKNFHEANTKEPLSLSERIHQEESVILGMSISQLTHVNDFSREYIGTEEVF